MRNYQLSLPGPSEVDPRVLQELVRPNLPHYGELWVGIYRGVIEKLRKACRTDGRAFVLPSSGSGAIDAAFGSLGAKKVLVLNNGNFGSRLAEIARHHASRLTVIEKEAGVAFPLEQVEGELKTGRHDLLAMVHGETCTECSTTWRGSRSCAAVTTFFSSWTRCRRWAECRWRWTHSAWTSWFRPARRPWADCRGFRPSR